MPPFPADTARPLWPVILVMSIVLVLGLPVMLRHLWPGMKTKTVWIIALVVALLFAFVLAPTMVALSNNMRGGRSM